MGSGSSRDFRAIVGVDEEREDGEVHLVGFGKGEGFSDQSSQTLAQGAVETFDMVCARFGVTLGELLLGNDFGIRFPNIGKAVRFFVSVGNGLPQRKTGLLATISNGKRHHLASAPTQRQPNPAFVFASFDETPNLVQFQFIAFLKLGQSRLQRRQTHELFLSHEVTVWRETPKIRVKPRKLVRS